MSNLCDTKAHKQHTLLPLAPSSSSANTDVMKVSSFSHGSKAAPNVSAIELALGVGSRP